MNFVQPIRDPIIVRDMAAYLKKQSDRNYIMFMLGIYSGLRISDILKLRVCDVKDKDYISIREKKTGKQQYIKINPLLKREIARYVKGKDPGEYLIKSREGNNKAITREMAYKILKQAGQEFYIESIGTHTLRKTFGYHFYKQEKDVAKLQEIFNHSDPAVTLKYIGIVQESLDDSIGRLKIF